MLPAATINSLKTKWRFFASAHPLAKGAISYAIMWPAGSLIQQTFEGKNLRTYDWMRCLRYSIFGAFYVAPTLYGWVRLSSVMWPQMTLRVGITKALVEQISYGPFACASFFFGMSLLELKTIKEAMHETREKFLPTYKVGICVWPILQTINFAMIPEHNRLIFVSFCSLIWTSFLAYVKSRESSENDEISEQSIVPLSFFNKKDKLLQ